ncbi:MAG TPA: hypothetical protein VEY91_07155 [Candidatus Limnocylindria bacterium]|nr:hypothetical protein [Candidatus Limnocylindria bacterium]
MPRTARALAPLVAAWLTLTGLSAGCDGLFRPAVPEQAEDGTLIQRDYSDPDATLNTLKLAIEAKGLNGGNEAYLDGFADELRHGRAFRAFFDPADSAQRVQSGGTVPAWVLQNEQTFYSSFINYRTADKYRMTWEVDVENPRDDFGDTEATIHRKYTVVAESLDGSQTLVIAVGFADLLFYRSSGEWVINRWIDRIDLSIVVTPEQPEQRTLGHRRLQLQ